MSAPQIDAPGTDTDLGSSTVPAAFVPPARIPQTGPAEPYPRTERRATVTPLPNVADTGPIEPVTDTEDDSPDGTGPERPHTAEPAAQREDPAPTSTSERADQPEPAAEAELRAVSEDRAVAPEVPDRQPEPPSKPKESKWENATTVGYWMSVAVGAAGQIFALASWIHLGWASYPVAAAGAAFAEVTMIGASKKARNNRIAENPRPWKLLLVIACVICGYAAGMNFIHWLNYSFGMAVTFAGGSAVGFTVETTVEHIEAAEYERRRLKYEDELRRWKDRQARKAAKSRPAPRTTPQPRKSQPAATKTTKKRTPTQVRREKEQQLLQKIVAWAKENDASYRLAHQHFGSPARPSESTVKRALKG